MTFGDACSRLSRQNPEAFAVIVKVLEAGRPKQQDKSFYARFVGNIEGSLGIMRAFVNVSARKYTPVEDDLEERRRLPEGGMGERYRETQEMMDRVQRELKR